MVDRQLLILSRTSLKKLCASREKARALSERGSDRFAGIGGRSGQLTAEGGSFVAHPLKVAIKAHSITQGAIALLPRGNDCFGKLSLLFSIFGL